MGRSTSTALALGTLAMAAAACGVPQSQYDAKVADVGRAEGQNAELNKQVARLEADLAAARAHSAAAPGAAGAPTPANAAELEELRKQKAAAEARAKTYDELVARFKKMIDAGKLDISVRRGHIVLALETDVLFDSGKTDIKPEGKTALEEIADAVKRVAGRRFQVAGHTDMAPIKTKEFPSNWELSTARAVVVVKLLVSAGVQPGVLSAAGYAEFDPIGNNMTAPGRAHNRRIEIILEPNIEELIALPELKPAKH